MDKRLKESISALMDDEANELELQRVLAHADDEVSETWMRYHQIRQVLRTGDADVMAIDIRASLASHLDYTVEPESDSGFADVGGMSLDSDTAQSTSSQSVAPKPSRLRSAFAIAASGVLALVLATQYQQELSNASAPGLADASSGLSAGSVQETGLERVALISAKNDVPDTAPHAPKIIVEFSAEHAKRFNEYLLRHAEHSVYGAGQGVMPLARVASVNSVGI